MYLSHWGLRESPFSITNDIAFYFNGPTQEEALARLHFLVEQGRSLGILSGGEGSGKSTVLSVFSRELHRVGNPTCSVNVVGQDVRDFLWSLASGLGTNPRSDEDGFLLWRRIADRLEENHLLDVTTVLLLDDADSASRDVLNQVLRLLKSHQEKVTTIVSFDPMRTHRLGSDLLHHSQLRIHLDPWDEADVSEFLRSSLANAGRTKSVFDVSATTRLHELTGGIPRWVCQLAELALVAAAAQGCEEIGSDIIESAYAELSDTYREPTSLAG